MSTTSESTQVVVLVHAMKYIMLLMALSVLNRSSLVSGMSYRGLQIKMDLLAETGSNAS
jgi:hypothetical protein